MVPLPSMKPQVESLLGSRRDRDRLERLHHLGDIVVEEAPDAGSHAEIFQHLPEMPEALHIPRTTPWPLSS